MPKHPTCPKKGCTDPVFNRYCLRHDREELAKAAAKSDPDGAEESDPSD